MAAAALHPAVPLPSRSAAGRPPSTLASGPNRCTPPPRVPTRRAARPAPLVAANAAPTGGDGAPPTKASRLLAQGRAKYDAGDRMGGLRFFEEALSADPTPAERAAALFNATAVHASFGDVELAQITLREGVAGPARLDWEAAVAAGGSGDFVAPKWSPQVSIQLRKFAAGVKKAAADGGKGGGGGRPTPPQASTSSSSGAPPPPPGDLGERLQTDLVGLDGSVAGVAKRVAGLLAALLGLGVGLYLVGKGFLDTPPPLPPGLGE